MADLARQLLARRTTQPRFRLPLTAEQAERLLTAAYAAEVQYRGRKFEPDAFTRQNVRRLARFLTGETDKFGVMLCGTYGNGKTTLLYAFQNALAFVNSCMVLPEPYDRGIEVADAVLFARDCADPEKFRYYRDRPMLALEDIGRDNERIMVYGTTVYPVTDLLEYRYARQLFTFITTNLTPDELRAKYGQRVCDRFNEMEVIVFNKSDSYRKSQGSRAKGQEECAQDAPVSPSEAFGTTK